MKVIDVKGLSHLTVPKIILERQEMQQNGGNCEEGLC